MSRTVILLLAAALSVTQGAARVIIYPAPAGEIPSPDALIPLETTSTSYALP